MDGNQKLLIYGSILGFHKNKLTDDKNRFAFKSSITFILVAVEFASLKSVNSIEVWGKWLWEVTIADHYAAENSFADSSLAIRESQFPVSCFPVVWGSADVQHCSIEVNVFEEVKMLCIHMQVLYHMAMRHKWRKMLWCWKIWKAGHFFASVDDCRFINRTAQTVHMLGKFPESPDVGAFLKANWLEPFVQTAFYGGQTAHSCSNDGDFHG